MKKTVILFLVCLGFISAELLSAEPVLESPLGPAGEITKWLVLGEIPLPDAKDKAKWAETADRDLLAAVGGEAGIKPVGGQDVKLPEGTYTWKVVSARMPPGYAIRDPSPGSAALLRPFVFRDAKGADIEYASIYLYCRILADRAQNVSFLLGSDDSMKLFFNGKLVHRFVGQRSAGVDSEEVTLALNEGMNELLIRVDNYVFSGGFVGRLLARNGTLPTGVRLQIPADQKTPECPPPPPRPRKPWAEVVAEIPPLPPAFQQDLFGSRLTRTMALLQAGAQTRRPVRIVCFGQSITAQEWTDLLVERLRERYPGTIIQMENHSIGGWFVWRLMRIMYHGVLQARPDLVIFSAYQGNYDHWERVLSAIRRETNAEIILRTAHVDRGVWERRNEEPRDNSEVVMLRHLAQKYDCEFIECRNEWIGYLETNSLQGMDFLRDGIHLNRKGDVLMAQLFERHFRMNFNARSWWADRIRWYEALRPLSDRIDDEIRYSGDGWAEGNKWSGNPWVESAAKNSSLKLKFTGTRVDVVLGPRAGGARVLIDGKVPSALNLYYGTCPRLKVGNKGSKSQPWIMRYFTGPDMREEVWEFRWTHLSEDGSRFRFTLSGSETGFDGEGDSESDFVSKSGRIRIARNDFTMIVPVKGAPPAGPEGPAALKEPIVITWRILPRFKDEIRWVKPAESMQGIPDWNYVTMADGLPYGEHELTIIPCGDGPVAIRGIEVYRPPLGGR